MRSKHQFQDNFHQQKEQHLNKQLKEHLMKQRSRSFLSSSIIALSHNKAAYLPISIHYLNYNRENAYFQY